MSGIAGWVDYGDYGRDLFAEDLQMEKMSAALAHRGPDEEGDWKSHQCYLIHRRQVVIDQENGKQPMQCEHGGEKYIITYNGELYNIDELRAELLQLGFSFVGYSDTEVVLKAYIAWDKKCLDKLNGMYAFAVWNDTQRTLFLARDRVGAKPLFYYQYDRGIIFASEIRALLTHRYIKPQIDKNGIASMILLGPARKNGDGVFKNIKELAPAGYTLYSKNSVYHGRHWSLKAKEHDEDFEQTAEHVHDLITDSVERQLVSDVPLCTFLSGGLDSSIISIIAARKFQRENNILCTYSVDYKDNRLNFMPNRFQLDEDAPWIVKMSEFINSKHSSCVLDTPQLIDTLSNAADARALPGMADIDCSFYLFCQEVKKSFSVALSGEGADELFGGYAWYHQEELLFKSGFPWSSSVVNRFHLLRDGIISKDDAYSLVNNECRKIELRTDYLDSDTRKDRRMREMFMLNFYGFMQMLLERKDRMSMASGLEVRVPFCDYRIAEYAYNIPWEMKAYQNREKGLVRYAFREELPHSILWRKKSPYPKTHNPIYFKKVIENFADIINQPDCRLAEFLDKNALQALIDTHALNFSDNWYGQLMSSPQIFAYLIQMEYWLRENNIELLL